jgi:hypothetical protein
MKRCSIRSLATLLLTGLVAAVFAGTAIAKAPPGDCGWDGMTQPFLAWGDSGSYMPIPGASFEGSLDGWTLDGGAALTTGNESSFVNSATDAQSLALPDGSDATTPQVCVTVESPTMRLFVLNTGAKDAKLTVSLNFVDDHGNPKTQKLKDLPGNSSWTLVDPLKFLGPINSVLDHNGKTNVSFTFSPKDKKGNWQIDDAYVDPIKHS